MVHKKFRVSATVNGDNPPVIKPVLNRIFEGKSAVKEIAQGFEIDAELEGEDADALAMDIRPYY